MEFFILKEAEDIDTIHTERLIKITICILRLQNSLIYSRIQAYPVMGRILPPYNKDFYGSTQAENVLKMPAETPWKYNIKHFKNKNKTAAQLKCVISTHKGNLWKNISFVPIGCKWELHGEVRTLNSAATLKC